MLIEYGNKKTQSEEKILGENHKKGLPNPEGRKRGPIQRADQPEELPNSEPPGTKARRTCFRNSEADGVMSTADAHDLRISDGADESCGTNVKRNSYGTPTRKNAGAR